MRLLKVMNLLTVDEPARSERDTIQIGGLTWRDIKVGIAEGNFDAFSFIEKLNKEDLEIYQKLNANEDPQEEETYRLVAQNKKVILIQKQVLEQFLEIFRNCYKKEYQYAYQRFGIMQN